ncbi:MAG: tetratricopeptide repeat protein [Deltaproteobacteria bacterium]|nr:tetratricopeptide repeat protein [Deltaproteobacteria bacterium]
MKRGLTAFLLFLLFSAGESVAEETGQDTLVRPEPKGALAWFKQGVELTRQGEYKAALQRFRRAKSLAPNWALPYVEIAVAHMMTDNDRTVIGPALAKAVRLGGDIPRAHSLYGLFRQENANRKKAIKEFIRALQLRPSLTDARFRLSTLFVEEGRQTDGIHQYELLVKYKPSHVGAHRNLAFLLEQSGRFEDAEQHLVAIASLFPTNAYHQTNLGRFYERVGWNKKAKAAFVKAERIESTRDKRKLRPLLNSRDKRREADPMED